MMDDKGEKSNSGLRRRQTRYGIEWIRGAEICSRAKRKTPVLQTLKRCGTPSLHSTSRSTPAFATMLEFGHYRESEVHRQPYDATVTDRQVLDYPYGCDMNILRAVSGRAHDRFGICRSP